MDVSEAGSARVCGVDDCARLLPTLSDPREASGPRIGRIPLACDRPLWAVSTANPKYYLFHPPVSVLLISLGQYLTDRYSNDCLVLGAFRVRVRVNYVSPKR